MENVSNGRSYSGDITIQPPQSPERVVNTEGSDAGQGGHRRSLSGNILGSLPFLKKSSSKGSAQRAEDQHEEGQESSKRASSLATALRQTPGRKRKGSLRKTAMLGTGKLMREHRNSLCAALNKPAIVTTEMKPQEPAADIDNELTPRRFDYEQHLLDTSDPGSGWSQPDHSSVSSTASQTPESHRLYASRVAAHQLANPVAPQYASTTDDEEGISFYRPAVSSSASSYPSQIQAPGPISSLQRRRSNRAGQQSSPTVVQSTADMEIKEWDYSETEWWGWVILIMTWIVFVVGMGSCLGVWSWAWDVGETPYAPPELEDDPTLPITGYYPALFVCTAVMAWVWVVVAWVGMKYFRHAKEG